MEIFIVIVNLLLCAWVGSAAWTKNRSRVGWFFLSVFITPLLGGLILLIAGEKKEIKPL
jgi:hypothetical protein